MGISSGKCTSKARLDQKTAIITGANTGLGKYTALDFYKRGCRVIMACRNTDKAEKAKREIQESLKDVPNTGFLIVKELDLASIKSIKSFSEDILQNRLKIHILVNNAGVCFCPKSYTEDGFELQFGTNYLGHFLLTLLLIPILIESAPARIVILTSVGHKMGTIDFENLNSEKSYNWMWAYFNSKLANIIFVKELARRLERTNVNAYAVYPGFVKTDIGRHLINSYSFLGSDFVMNWLSSYFVKTVEQGAQTTIHCSVDEKLEHESGLYYADCKVTDASFKARDLEVAKKLWEVSCDLLKLNDYDPFELLQSIH